MCDVILIACLRLIVRHVRTLAESVRLEIAGIRFGQWRGILPSYRGQGNFCRRECEGFYSVENVSYNVSGGRRLVTTVNHPEMLQRCGYDSARTS